MAKLSEISSQNYFKGLIVGPSGVGKTVSSMTFPGEKKVMDFDGKVDSAAEFYRDNKELLSKVDVTELSKMPIVGDAKTGRKPRFQYFLDELKGYYNLQNNKQKLPFETIIIDTMTTMGDSLLEDYRYVSQLGVKRPNQDQNSQSDYGLFGTHMKQIVTGLLMLDCNVVFLAHCQVDTDESTGIKTNQILMPGAMKDKLGIYFKEVYLQKIGPDKKRYWQTQADARTPWCRSQKKNMPAEILAEYSEIIRVR